MDSGIAKEAGATVVSQTLLLQPESSLETGFSIGICAADRATRLENLLSTIKNESFQANFTLKKVIIIASGCDAKALTFARQLAFQDMRFELIEEPVRSGKSDAINRIIARHDGRFLVLVNSDAIPERGAISELLRVIHEDKWIGIVSAAPLLGESHGITGYVLRLIWGLHNECLLKLNYGGQSNRCCDELVVARDEVLHKLPADTVNDGAYLAANAYAAGYTIRFCERAKVKIDVPQNFLDILRQRRRIVYGHLQIRQSMGQTPKTLESMLVTNPFFSLTILIRTLAKSPELLIALPFALIVEAASVILALWDTMTSTKKHGMWKRYGNKS